MSRLRLELDLLLLAVQFLTRVPVSGRVRFDAGRANASARYYPLVGVAVGLVAAGVFWIADRVFHQSIAAIASTAATLLLTGAFHEDGFADVCDGIGGGATRERALDIMKDSRLGTYGVTGIGLLMAAKIAALATAPPALAPLMLIAAHGASRSSAVVVVATSDYVRDAGTAKPTADGISVAGLLVALATGGLALTGLVLTGHVEYAAGAAIGLLAGHVLMRRFFERKLAGYTGDCLGAVQQTSELGVYLGVLACL